MAHTEDTLYTYFMTHTERYATIHLTPNGVRQHLLPIRPCPNSWIGPRLAHRRGKSADPRRGKRAIAQLIRAPA